MLLVLVFLYDGVVSTERCKFALRESEESGVCLSHLKKQLGIMDDDSIFTSFDSETTLFP